MVCPTGLRGFGFFFSMVRPTGLRGRGRVFFNGPPNGPGGFRFFFNGPGGFRIFFFNGPPNGSGEVSIFNGSPNGSGGVSFFNGPPNGSGGVSFFNGSPNGSGGVSFFNGLPNASGDVSFFNGSPNGSGGKGGQSALEFGGGVVGFLFRGTESASGAVKGGWRRVSFGVVFCGEWRRVSFRGCEGGRGASQLWSLVVVSSFFLFRGDGGQSASGAVKGEGGPVSFGVWWWCRRFFCFGGTGASQLPGL